jgi:pilus assembly protein CpaF
MEGDIVTMSDIFKFERAGYENGRVIGKLRPTGLRPRFMEKIEAENIRVPPGIFGAQSRRRF